MRTQNRFECGFCSGISVFVCESDEKDELGERARFVQLRVLRIVPLFWDMNSKSHFCLGCNTTEWMLQKIGNIRVPFLKYCSSLQQGLKKYATNLLSNCHTTLFQLSSAQFLTELKFHSFKLIFQFSHRMPPH
jgi:hypothetical protein